MKLGKIMGTIVLVLGIILIACGGYVIHFDINHKNTKKEANSEIKSQEEYDKILNVERNKSEKLSQKKCLDNICFENLKIFRQNDIYFITATITNTGLSTIDSKYINIIFKTNNGQIKKEIYEISHLKAKKSQTYERHFLEDGDLMIKEIVDYTLEFSTEDEINTINK